MTWPKSQRGRAGYDKEGLGATLSGRRDAPKSIDARAGRAVVP
jgi:hypothetical protein